MTVGVSWHTLLDELDDLPEGATLITPLSDNRFRVTDVQEQRVVIEYLDRDVDGVRPLERDQFETLWRRVTDEPDGFELDRLPPDADPYPAVLSLHPRFEIDGERGVIDETEGSTSTQLLDADGEPETGDGVRTEPDLDVYADALVNLYTLLTGVDRGRVDEQRKQTRLQGLKDRLAAAEGEETEALRAEVEELEARIDELTEFRSGGNTHGKGGVRARISITSDRKGFAGDLTDAVDHPGAMVYTDANCLRDAPAEAVQTFDRIRSQYHPANCGTDPSGSTSGVGMAQPLNTVRAYARQ